MWQISVKTTAVGGGGGGEERGRQSADEMPCLVHFL